MTFVPIVPAHEPAPSPNTQELAGQLSATIREFLRSHPGTSAAEIRHALRLATAGYASSITARLVAVLLGLMLAGGLGLFYLASRGNFEPGAAAFPIILGALAVLALVGVLVAIKR